jgi:hypothetical protein
MSALPYTPYTIFRSLASQAVETQCRVASLPYTLPYTFWPTLHYQTLFSSSSARRGRSPM